ncbi:MAG: TIGR04168 family protein [Cyanothece sp. SIO1E1]|nr:TIGR04168 family protein [Cyanothece sp. SIO1E1]
MVSCETVGNRIIKIAVVGDVHNQWDVGDEAALKQLEVDLVLFVGDFGNESVELIQRIAALDIPKAAIMGNHDAWYSATPWGRKKCPYDRQTEDWVQQQLDLLGESHVGYGKLDFPALNLTVVGGRPFSWGGPTWKNSEFYQERYSISNFEQSITRIMAGVKAAAHETVVFIGHCGPTGLGDRPEDPCGKDWKPIGGDYGDPDLAEAIAQAQSLGKTVPLVTFGHMHHRLRHTQQHLRKIIDVSATGTIYLNAASVPRIIKTETDCLRNFSLVSLQAGKVLDASLVWLDQDCNLATEQKLYSQTSPALLELEPALVGQQILGDRR